MLLYHTFFFYRQAEATKISKTILLTDPSKEEEYALDGRIVFSVNAHK